MGTVRPLVSIDDPAAADPSTAGEKAAGLARARKAGLPALAGYVVPIDIGAATRREGARRLAQRGPAAACLAVSDAELEPGVASSLGAVAAALGERLIVRSSTPQDLDPRWAGAFSTYEDVSAGELPAAVRGCWASAFTRDAVARADLLGVDMAEVGVGVLIQPWLPLEARGAAWITRDGVVRIVSVAGDHDTHPAAERREIEALARSVRAGQGADAIEWGISEGRVILLQVRIAAEERGAPDPIPEPDALPGDDQASLERIAGLANRFPAPLGEEVVLPWALAPFEVPDALPLERVDPREGLREIRRLAGSLAAQAWGGAPAEATDRASAVFRSLLTGDPGSALRTLGALHPYDHADAARVLSLLDALGRELTVRGLLAHPEGVWRASIGELTEAASGGARLPARLAPDRWEPFVHSTLRGRSGGRAGVPAAGGLGAGRIALLRSGARLPEIGPRRVLWASEPLPQIAPLLWGAAGLVTSRGSEAAHLFEVARSLGVPAVIGVDLRGSTPSLVAIDGDAGRIWVGRGERSDER